MSVLAGLIDKDSSLEINARPNTILSSHIRFYSARAHFPLSIPHLTFATIWRIDGLSDRNKARTRLLRSSPIECSSASLLKSAATMWQEPVAIFTCCEPSAKESFTCSVSWPVYDSKPEGQHVDARLAPPLYSLFSPWTFLNFSTTTFFDPTS